MRRHLYAALLVAGLMPGATTVAAPGLMKPGYNAALEARFLRSIPRGATLPAIRRLLPPGVKAAQPVFRDTFGPTGNFVKLSGRLNGWLVFLSDAQRAGLERENLTPADIRRITVFRATDPIHSAFVLMDNGKDVSRAASAQRIAALTKYLGPPRVKEYHQATAEAHGGWDAEWPSHKPYWTIRYADATDYDSLKLVPMLTLSR